MKIMFNLLLLGVNMAHRIVAHEGIKIIGVELKTTMKDGPQDIPIFWAKHFDEQTLDKIPNKVDPAVSYGIYTDYAQDGSYTLIIGMEVKSFETIPHGMIAKTIPAANYALFTAKGPIHESVSKMWATIWNLPEIFTRRALTFDFERYDQRALQGDAAEVDIYIALKR